MGSISRNERYPKVTYKEIYPCIELGEAKALAFGTLYST